VVTTGKSFEDRRASLSLDALLERRHRLPRPGAFDRTNLAGRPGEAPAPIHLALFAEEYASFGITPIQFGVLTAPEPDIPLDPASPGGHRLHGLIRRVASATDSALPSSAISRAWLRRLRRIALAARRAPRADHRGAASGRARGVRAKPGAGGGIQQRARSRQAEAEMSAPAAS